MGSGLVLGLRLGIGLVLGLRLVGLGVRAGLALGSTVKGYEELFQVVKLNRGQIAVRVWVQG